jgi:hypothetical protein
MRSMSVLLIATVLVMAVIASAQSADSQDENTRQRAARCTYTQSDDSCASPSSSSQESDGRPIAQAQFPTRGPRFSHPRMPRSHPSSAFPYGSYDDGHHAAIGGFIGFGTCFALGAVANNNSGSRVASGLVAGALGAVFGAAIGHAIDTFPHASFHRRNRWTDEDDSAYAASHLVGTRQATHRLPHSGN